MSSALGKISCICCGREFDASEGVFLTADEKTYSILFCSYECMEEFMELVGLMSEIYGGDVECNH